MKVTQVEYRRLHSFGAYENETVGYTASVEPGENAEAVLTNLKELVAADLAVRAVEQRHQAERDQLTWQVDQLRRQYERGIHQYEELRALLERHGVTIDPPPPAGDPFAAEDSPF